jgi:hypothetical protein
MEKKFIVAQSNLAKAIAEAHLDFAMELERLSTGYETPAPAKAEKKPAKKEAPVVEVEADEADEEGIDLDAMDLKQLKKFAKDNDIDLGEKRITANTARKLILEALEAEDEAEEEEEDENEDDVDVDADEDGEDEDDSDDEEEDGDDEESEDGYTEEELKELEEEELLELAEHYEIEPSYKGKGKAKKLQKKALISAILEAQEEALGDEDGEEEDEEVDYVEELGLKEMEVEELAELLEEYGLSTKGKKQALIDRIVTAIEDGTIELDDEEEGE